MQYFSLIVKSHNGQIERWKQIAVDLVGISCMTALAPRAYEISARFLKRGIPVVLGGMHPALLPAEALGHATPIVAGDAEGVWPKVVEDAKNGNLAGFYRSETPLSLFV